MMRAVKKEYSIGIDIGATKMNAVLFDGEKIVFDYMLSTPKDSIEKFMAMLFALIDPLIEKARKNKVRVKGIGLGVAGAVDFKERIVLVSPNLTIIENEKIASQLEIKTGLPVYMDNDANAFIRAEALAGAGKKYHNIYGITIGTGIGGGWWHNGEIYQGVHGGAGEPSVMVVDYQNGLGLEAAYQRLMKNNALNVAEEAYRGDVLAEKAFQELGTLMGIAFANIANILDPEIFVIGGSVVESSDLFLKEARMAMKKFIESPIGKKEITIVKSKLGKHAGAVGAALLVKN